MCSYLNLGESKLKIFQCLSCPSSISRGCWLLCCVSAGTEHFHRGVKFHRTVAARHLPQPRCSVSARRLLFLFIKVGTSVSYWLTNYGTWPLLAARKTRKVRILNRVGHFVTLNRIGVLISKMKGERILGRQFCSGESLGNLFIQCWVVFMCIHLVHATFPSSSSSICSEQHLKCSHKAFVCNTL